MSLGLRFELKFGNVGFRGEKKTGVPGGIKNYQGKEDNPKQIPPYITQGLNLGPHC